MASRGDGVAPRGHAVCVVASVAVPLHSPSCVPNFTPILAALWLRNAS